MPGSAARAPVERARRALLEHRFGKALELFRRQEGWRALGFVRMADYLSERLGLGLRTAQELLRTEKALTRLPRTAAAWMSGRISASHLRILTRVATERTESWWLMLATRMPVGGLAAEVARWRRHQLPSSLPETAQGDDLDEEPERMRQDLSAPAWIVVLWRQTAELVRKVAGRRLPFGSCIDVLLAEAQGTAPVWEQEAPVGPSLGREAEEDAEAAAADRAPSERPRASATSIIDRLATRPYEPGRVPWWRLLPVRERRRDARALDEELRTLASGRQREEADLARRLRLAAVTRSYRSEGYKTLESWGRETMGLSARRLYYLLALHRRLEALPGLKSAFLEGRLTMRQALLVGSVATRRTEAAWIVRASEVTLRRLDDEVSWWRHLKEVRPEVWTLLRGGPVPAGLVLAPGHSPRLHACAPPGQPADPHPAPPDEMNGSESAAGSRGPARPVTASELLAALDAHEAAVPLPERISNITFWLEPEVHSMWRTRCEASRHESGEPMEAWEVLAILMYNYWKTWDNKETRRQRREHATLERDGWRCTAPGCTSMGSGMLHEHHVIYRSRGGAVADLTNTTTLCTAHHLGLLHGGFMRCFGEAPDNLTWELGVGDGQEPFLIYEGDRIVGGTGKKS